MDGELILSRLGGRRRVLLLQGPCGLFFSRLAAFLAAAGCEVSKVNFNAGDEFFYLQPEPLSYRGSLREWSPWLERLIIDRAIDSIILFGDCRPIHAQAIEVARRLGRQSLVFEEGYLRPGFVTLEVGGVNAKSPLKNRFMATHWADALAGVRGDDPVPVKPAGVWQRLAQFWAMSWQGAAYTLAMRIGRRAWPNYAHHKPFRLRSELPAWLLSGWRKIAVARTDQLIGYRFEGELSGRFFVVPLQVYNDSQLTVHSDFPSVETFIQHVVESFASHAPGGTHLVFKHHPMDRGHRHYGRLLGQLAQVQSLRGRLHYVHDLRLPMLLRHSLGAVTVNSTAGLSALYHRVPVVCLGKSFYDGCGLTHQNGLDSFWRTPIGPQPRDVQRLRALMLNESLVPGSFYAGGIDGRVVDPTPDAVFALGGASGIDAESGL